jgi:hypothetical protein
MEALLVAAGVSCRRLSLEMRRHPVTVWRWIHGKRRPQGDDLALLLAHLFVIESALKEFG